MYAKLSAGGANYDLVMPTDYIVSLMIRQGLLQKLDKSKLPMLEQPSTRTISICLRSQQQVHAALPGRHRRHRGQHRRRGDVRRNRSPTCGSPEYAGRMVMLDDSRAIIGMTLLTLGYDVNTTDPAQLEEAKVKLAELVPNVKLFDSDSPKTALIAGDVDLGMTWTGEAVLAQREMPAIEFIYPTEGPILWQDNYAIPVDAPSRRRGLRLAQLLDAGR
jgi:spermidine/putrescine-binding protein